jgi:lipoprotein NlpI
MRALGLCLILFCVAPPAAAGAIDDARAAGIAQEQGDLDAAIRLYDRAIAAGALENQYLAIAYYYRGNIYFARRDYVAAIADYDIAVVLKPDNALAHNNMGNAYNALGVYDKSVAAFDAALRIWPGYALAYKNRGNAHAAAGYFERAIADYDIALGYAPDLAKTYNNRANARFFLGRFAAAIADYRAALDIDPNDIYSMLWLYLAEGRAGGDGGPGLKGRAAALDGGDWPAPVARHYIGAVSGADVLAAARQSPAETRRERECEANFYLGAKRLIDGDRDGAARLFQAAIDTGVVHFAEYLGARAELARMGSLP